MNVLNYRHQRAQRLRRLVSRRAARDEEGCFVLEGVNLLEEALAAGTEVESVYLDAGGADQGVPLEQRPDSRLARLTRRCHDSGLRVYELEKGVLARVAGTVTPQPVLAVARTPQHSWASVCERRPSLVVVCVDVRDPGNAGTVARSAWAAGADAVVFCQGAVDVWNPKTVRASAGAVLHLPVVCAGPVGQVLAEVGSAGLYRWGAVATGGQSYDTTDLSVPTALVLGNEANGLDLSAVGDLLDGLVTIPMAGTVESINVGMAAAVLCFEAARQRRRVSACGPRGELVQPPGKAGKLAGS